MSVRLYFCRGCDGPGRQFKWKGCCPHCRGLWSIIERRVSEDGNEGAERFVEMPEGEVVSFCDIIEDVSDDYPKVQIGGKFADIDWIFCSQGGIVLGSVSLLAGDPGIGKSTLVFQTLQQLAKKNKVLYVSGEESVKQIAQRYKKLGKFDSKLQVVKDSSLDNILEKVLEIKPKVVAIDSIQMVSCTSETTGYELEAGSPSAITLATRTIKKFAEQEGIAFIIIGHVTQDGSIAGPNSGLIHHVDSVFKFSGVPKDTRRVLRPETGKNRFGPAGPHVYVELNMGKDGLSVVDKGFAVEKGEIVPKPEPEEEDEEAEIEPAPVKALPPARTKPRLDAPQLKSIPLEGEQVTWVSADGITAKAVLEVACDNGDCNGKRDRACTAENGAREVGFHESRIIKARAKRIEEERDHEHKGIDAIVGEIEREEAAAVDPFAKKFGAPPRVKSKAKAKTSKKKPKPEPEIDPPIAS